MKITTKDTPVITDFIPTSITLTFEQKEELQEFLSILNLYPIRNMCKHLPFEKIYSSLRANVSEHSTINHALQKLFK